MIPVRLVFTVKLQHKGMIKTGNGPMVEFVGHTLLLSGVRLDIDDIANAVVYEVSGQFNASML